MNGEDRAEAIEVVQAVCDERERRYDQRFLQSERAVEAALVQAEKAVQAALVAAEKAVDKAEKATEKRLEAVNEFRAQQRDLIAEFMRSEEARALIGNVNEKLERLRAEAVERAELLRHEAQEKIATNLKESTARIEAVDRRIADRLDGSNVLMNAISERLTLALPRAEYDVQHRALEDQVADLATKVGKAEAATTAVQQFKGYLIGLCGLIITIAVFVGVNTLR